ncbi:MAG: YceD family protein [Hyphomicrobiales bacterium]
MIDENKQSAPPELSHVLGLGEVSKTGVDVEISANADEREALAGRYAIESVDSLNASLHVRPWRKEGLHVKGTLKAEVEQTCVVSLEPVKATISAKFSVYFLPAGENDQITHGELTLDPESEDELDVLSGGTIDLGEVVAEQLAVRLDPYPRKPGIDASSVLKETDANGDSEKPNPFDVLKSIKGAGQKDIKS